jgi:GNAT superfamily N-acetyltransferase
MHTAFDRLTQFLNEDELRHIPPLKMLGLYREHMRVLPVAVGVERAFVMLAPRAASQWDSAHYPSATQVLYPVLPAMRSQALLDACAQAVVQSVGSESFVVKSCEQLLIEALRQASPELSYQRALLTFTPADDSDAHPQRGASRTHIRISSMIPPAAAPLLAAHGVYSASELETMFADGTSRCLLGLDGEKAVAVALTFPNTSNLHEIGSLYVAPHARRAGHAGALVRAALTDIASRQLAVRYVVDATNTPSIALATRCGLREVMRLEHWLSA